VSEDASRTRPRIFTNRPANRYYAPEDDPAISNTVRHYEIACALASFRRKGPSFDFRKTLKEVLPPVILHIFTDRAVGDWEASSYNDADVDANVFTFMKSHTPTSFRETRIALELVIAVLVGPLGNLNGENGASIPAD
jgi:hypothetical protein